jgi:hypothetical protein
MERLIALRKRIEIPLFILVSLFCIFEIFSECNQLIKHPRYTIGVITEFYYSGYGVKSIRYTYKVNGVEYEKGAFYSSGEIGRRYFVKFSSLNPRYNDLFEDSPVPDTLQYVPPEGWEKIPKGSAIYKAPDTY